MCLELTVVSGCETQLEQVVAGAPQLTGELPVLLLSCLGNTQSHQVPRHLPWFAPSFSFFVFCWWLLSACSTPPPTSTSRYTQVGTAGKLWWDLNMQRSCADNWCLVVKKTKQNKNWELFPVNKVLRTWNGKSKALMFQIKGDPQKVFICLWNLGTLTKIEPHSPPSA